MAVVTFHVRKTKFRTTVSLERVLADLLSIRLHDTVDRSVVAKWCQDQVNEDPGAYERSASQRLSGKAALALAPKEVQERYWELVLAEAPKALRKGKRRRFG